ncbi:MAG: hypothetical protein ACK4RK_16875 [Gemmataceae bacterium]
MRQFITVGWGIVVWMSGAVWGQEAPPPEAPPSVVAHARAELAERIGRVERLLPELTWQVQPQPWTPAMLQQVAEMLGQRERAEKVLHSWLDGQSVVWSQRAAPDRMIALALVRFASSEAARAYQGLAIDLQRRQDEFFAAASPSRRVLDSRGSSWTIPGVEEAIRSDKKLVLSDDSPPIAVTIVIIRHGPLVLELSGYNQTIDPAWAEQVARLLLAPLIHSVGPANPAAPNP